MELFTHESLKLIFREFKARMPMLLNLTIKNIRHSNQVLSNTIYLNVYWVDLTLPKCFAK